MTISQSEDSAPHLSSRSLERVLAAGTLDDLRQNPSEDLEDIFIRLVGASVDEIETKTGSPEEE